MIVRSIHADSNEADTLLGYVFIGLIRLFSSRKEKNIGRTIISVSIIIYTLSGLFWSLIWQQDFVRILVVHVLIGIVWGISVQKLFKNRYF